METLLQQLLFTFLELCICKLPSVWSSPCLSVTIVCSCFDKNTVWMTKICLFHKCCLDKTTSLCWSFCRFVLFCAECFMNPSAKLDSLKNNWFNGLPYKCINKNSRNRISSTRLDLLEWWLYWRHNGLSSSPSTTTEFLFTTPFNEDVNFICLFLGYLSWRTLSISDLGCSYTKFLLY